MKFSDMPKTHSSDPALWDDEPQPKMIPNPLYCEKCGGRGYLVGDVEWKPYAVQCDECADRRQTAAKVLVDRFLAWPLPQSVCSDLCVTDPNYKSPRSGTNLLTANEAKQMIEYLLAVHQK